MSARAWHCFSLKIELWHCIRTNRFIKCNINRRGCVFFFFFFFLKTNIQTCVMDLPAEGAVVTLILLHSILLVNNMTGVQVRKHASLLSLSLSLYFHGPRLPCFSCFTHSIPAAQNNLAHAGASMALLYLND